MSPSPDSDLTPVDSDSNSTSVDSDSSTVDLGLWSHDSDSSPGKCGEKYTMHMLNFLCAIMVKNKGRNKLLN